MGTRRVSWVSWVILILTLAAPALAQKQPKQPPDETRPKAREGYIVGIEDELEIVVWGEANLTKKVKVRPDGKISLPLANDIEVAGLTPDKIRQVIAEKLAQFVREPNVTVVVDQINSFRVYFLGEVNAQGMISFYRPTRLLQGIASAGGLTEFAKKEITLIREAYGVEQRIPIDFKRLLAGDPSQENIYLQPGDVLLFH
jgi:polysaccharide export outer membrane protein